MTPARRQAERLRCMGSNWLTSAEVRGSLTELRRSYHHEVRAIAERLSLQFQARRFDSTKPEDEWETQPGCEFSAPPFLILERLCEALPMCQNRDSARLVIAVSKYADRAAYSEIESGETHPNTGGTWIALAGWCLSRDVHDYAIRRGWASTRRERDDGT